MEIGDNCTRQQTQYNEGIFFANSTANGCTQRTCPCEMWINCRQYNIDRLKDLHPSDSNNELHKWYLTYFKIKYEYADFIGNGWHNMNIIPECNLGIEKCKNGTKERNAIFLATEADYMLYYQTTVLPYPKTLFGHMNFNNNAAIIRE